MIAISEATVTGIVVAILGSGVITGIGKLLTRKPEATVMVADAATVVVRLQREYIAEQDARYEQLNERMEQLEQERGRLRDRVARAEAKLRDAEAAKERVERQNRLLADKVKDLELRIQGYGDRLTHEESRNTDIERAARTSEDRADAAEARADEHGTARPEEHDTEEGS